MQSQLWDFVVCPNGVFGLICGFWGLAWYVLVYRAMETTVINIRIDQDLLADIEQRRDAYNREQGITVSRNQYVVRLITRGIKEE